jgi:tetratricopeptide (TPR) repeat protein
MMFKFKPAGKEIVIAVMGVIAAALFAPGPGWGDDLDTRFHRELKKGYQALDYWDHGLAEEIGIKLREIIDDANEKNDSRQFEWLKYETHLYFHMGRYDEALKYARQAAAVRPDGGKNWEEFHERVRNLARLWKGAKESRSEHFIIRYLPGPEEVLLEPGLDALEKAYIALKQDLQVQLDRGPVLVEIYPSVTALSAAVGLTESEIKASGTIAICRYGRLMITTPRQLLRGYDYLTTMSHELVHYMIYLRNGPHCPIWLHEGLAKYEEDRWKGEPGGQLDPVSQSLLASAIRQDEFISFDQMYPTFAKFDSPAKGQLAFAEVVTVVDYLAQEEGIPRLFPLLDLLKEGTDDKDALERCAGKDFEEFWKSWKGYVASKDFKEIPGIRVPEMKFRDNTMEELLQPGDDEDDMVGEEEYAENEAWKYVRLGDLLRNRNYLAAAALEYEKAYNLLPYQPRIQNKLAFSLILMGRYHEALKPLSRAKQIYPNYVTTYMNMGRAYSGLGDVRKAAFSFEKALTLNPFDPEPYRHLIKLYEEMGEVEERDMTVERLKIISRR